jgi:creatinine amidohydrolase
VADLETVMTTRILVLATLLVLASAVLSAQPAQQPPAGAPGAQGRGGNQRRAPDPRSMGGGDCRDNPYNCADTANPLSPPDTVWLEEMTWIDVRDALKAGKTTIIVPTGGIEPNGPWLVLGKHNYVLRTNCDAIARKLGNALCAPIVELVPEGSIEPKRGHMTSPGTISLREETFQAVLTDVAHSLKMHGFESIIFIGDSGGNQPGQKAVAEKLNTQWNGAPVVAHIPEYYTGTGTGRLLNELGVTQDGQPEDGLHDGPGITLNMMLTDPNSVRWEQRVKAGKATINGVSIADKAKSLEIARKIVDLRATNTVAAIRKAIANKGKPATQQ